MESSAEIAANNSRVVPLGSVMYGQEEKPVELKNVFLKEADICHNLQVVYTCLDHNSSSFSEQQFQAQKQLMFKYQKITQSKFLNISY